MDAVVLAGGFSTRLRPFTITKHKSVLPVLGRPLILRLLDMIEAAGIFRRVFVAVHYMSESVEGVVRTHKSLNSVAVVREPQPLGDGGPLLFLDERYGLSEDFVVVNGDVYADVDFRAMYEYHVKNSCAATLAVAAVRDPTKYGVVIIGEDGAVKQLVEKPKSLEGINSNTINAGIYMFTRGVLKHIPKGCRASLARDVIPSLIRSGARVCGYPYRGLWKDIGTPHDYFELNMALLEQRCREACVEEGAVAVNAKIVPPTFVGAGSVVQGGVVGPYAIIMGAEIKEARVEQSIIMSGTVVASHSYVRGSIIGEGCHVGEWARVEDSIVGDGVLIREGVYLAPGTVVLPFKELTESVHERDRIII